MKRALAALCAVLAAGCASAPQLEGGTPPAAPAAADLPVHVYEEGDVSIRLMRGPCEHPQILAFFVHAAPEHAGRTRAIESTWPHRDGSRHEYAGCWLELAADEGGGEELLLLVFSDGQRFVVRKRDFLRGKGKGA